MTKPSRITRELLAEVAGYGSREAAAILSEKLGEKVGKTSINDARRKLSMPFVPRDNHPSSTGKKLSIEERDSGSLVIETQDGVPQTRETIQDRMRERGFDPEQYSLSYRFSEWEAQTPEGIRTMYAARAGATEKPKSASKATVDYEDLVRVIERHESGTAEIDPTVNTNTFIFNFADPQFGKTDINGGTEETITRFLHSLDHAEAMLEAEPAHQIIWADLGDGIENFCNTSSQRQTNDMNLVEQVRVLRRLQVEGLSRLRRHAPVVHISVPSNHSQNRVGPQAPASTAHDDWGLEVQQQLIDAFEMSNVTDVQFLAPDEHLESVSFTTVDGTKLGLVHGHRSNSQNGLEQWWAGQTLGRQPTADADILLVGHFHNLSVRSVGKERYIITTPSLDNGSSWFTVSRGNVATAGVLTMRVEQGMFRDLVIV